MSLRRMLICSVFVCWAIAFSAACQYGVTSSPASPTTDTTTSASTSTTTTTPTTPTTPVPAGLTYVKDIAPIMVADCTVCHGASRRDAGYDFTTYAGVMKAVSSTTSSAKLVKATQSNGVMYSQFKSNASTKSKTISDWVVTYKAAQQ